MDNQRDVQNSKRNSNSTLVMSGSSAVAMEIKRKKIRRSALFQEAEVRKNAVLSNSFRTQVEWTEVKRNKTSACLPVES